ASPANCSRNFPNRSWNSTPRCRTASRAISLTGRSNFARRACCNMAVPADINSPNDKGVATADLDFSRLVGRHIPVFSEQFPGKKMSTKVLAYAEGELLVNSAGNDGLIDSLIDRQTLIVQFPYKGQEISVRARIKRTQAGRCYFVLGSQ